MRKPPKKPKRKCFWRLSELRRRLKRFSTPKGPIMKTNWQKWRKLWYIIKISEHCKTGTNILTRQLGLVIKVPDWLKLALSTHIPTNTGIYTLFDPTSNVATKSSDWLKLYQHLLVGSEKMNINTYIYRRFLALMYCLCYSSTVFIFSLDFFFLQIERQNCQNGRIKTRSRWCYTETEEAENGERKRISFRSLESQLF